MRFPINSTFLEADHFIYVDATSGDDDANDGSEASPFKTMEKAFLKVDEYDANSSIGIILGDGEYNNSTFTRTTNNTNKIMVVGNTKSKLITTDMYANYGGDPCKCVVEYYRLIWNHGESISPNKVSFSKDVNIYNVVFADGLDDSYGYFYPHRATEDVNIHIQNCTKKDFSRYFLRTTNGDISVVDSIGEFTSGYSSTPDKWNVGGNIIQTVQYDSEYVPTSVEYKNLGIGENPDGTRSHVGVYGGEFAWGTWAMYLIEQGGKYYTVKNGAFEEVADLTLEFENKGCALSDIYDNLNLINGEFKLISNIDNSVAINGIKSKIEMVVANNDFPTTIQENIDYFECQADLSINGAIRIVTSIDEGVTWKTYADNQFKDLQITIPLKKYTELSPDELNQWNTARDVILAQGIKSTDLKSIDFNGLKSQKIRFAYVYSINDMNDVAKNNKLVWQFDSKGSMQKMKSTEYDIKVHSDFVEFMSLIDNDMIKVNLLPDFGVDSGSGGSSGFENQEW